MEQLVQITTRRPARAVTLTPRRRRESPPAPRVGKRFLAGLAHGGAAGGCSGFSYEMYFDSEVGPEDTVEDFDGVGVIVDNQSVDLLRGSTLDYQDGLMEAGFAINNPNVTRSCGCGNSFS